MRGDLTPDEFARVVVCASASAVVLFALVVVEYDLTYLRGNLRRRSDRIFWKWGSSAFIGLVGFGEAWQLFRLIAGEGPAPDARQAFTDGAWGLLSCFFLIARPLARCEIVFREPAAAGCGQQPAGVSPGPGSAVADSMAAPDAAPTVMEIPVPVEWRG